MASARTEELVKYDREHILHAQIPLGETLGVIYDSADGIVLRDTEGKEYLDASSQMVSANLGHGRREIIDAVKAQLDKLQHVGQYYGHSSTPMVECAQKLAAITPGDLDHFWFTSGGGESTDAAIRLVRRYFTAHGQPTKRKVISLYMSYHGMGNGPMNMTGIPAMQAGYGPEAPGYLKIPAYYCYRCPFGLEYPSCDTRCARFLETVIESEGPENVAAFIAEPELGASGFLVPPDDVLAADPRDLHQVRRRHDRRRGHVRLLPHRHDVLHRPLERRARRHLHVEGHHRRLRAVRRGGLQRQDLDGLAGVPLMHQYTFSGSPAGCAAAIAAIDVYVNDKVAENATRVGQHIVERIVDEFMPMPCVGTHSGLGLMLAIEIVADKETKAMFDPPVGPIMPLLDEARERAAPASDGL